MTRMDRATATWALALPRRRAIRAYRSPRKVAVRAAPMAAWPRDPRSQGVALAFLPGPGAGAGLAGRGAQPGPGHQVGGGGEPAHVQAGLGDDGPGQVFADAGDLGQPGPRVQHGGVRAGPGIGAGGPVRVDAPGGGHRRGQPGDAGAQLGDLAVEGGDLVQEQLGELAVVVIEHAVQRFDQAGMLGLHPAAGQGGQLMRVALAGDHRLDHVLRRDRGQRAGHGRYLDQRAFQQLFQPLEAAGALLGQPDPRAGVVPQVPDRPGRHERGPQQSHLGQPRQPLRVQLVSPGPARQVLRLGGVDQLHH